MIEKFKQEPFDLQAANPLFVVFVAHSPHLVGTSYEHVIAVKRLEAALKVDGMNMKSGKRIDLDVDTIDLQSRNFHILNVHGLF
jgi:hypothetical protein